MMDSDSEEEILVYAEFEDSVNIEKYRSIHVLGITEANPIIQMDDTFFTGIYKNSLGTYMFFEEDPSPQCSDPLFDKLSEKTLKYLYKTRKLLSMEHAYVNPKEGIEPSLKKEQPDDNIEMPDFNTVQEALEKFKEELNKTSTISGNLLKSESSAEPVPSTSNAMNLVLRELIQIMGTRDELFRNMKPKLDYLGSYFDGLRIGQPSEYDINVVLKIPVNYKKIILDATSTTDDYTSILMPSEFRRLSKKPGFIKTRMWCDSQYRLSVTKFRSWMQSVVDAALSTLPQHQDKRILCVNGKHYQIYAKTAGPANTITIVTDNMEGNIIDVDLVPTFEFKYPQKAIGSKVLFEKLKCSEHYFVVPKPSHNDYSWRLSFPLQERYYIKDKNNLKSTLRLLKLLRDVQGFKLLASYFIKSLFLYETDLKSVNFWRKHSMSYLLIYMMKKLTECLQKGEIKNYWCPDSNLLKGKLNIETCQNWSNRLAFIINDIEQNGKNNPQILLQYFTKKTSV